jgi:hypothetical protein
MPTPKVTAARQIVRERRLQHSQPHRVVAALSPSRWKWATTGAGVGDLDRLHRAEKSRRESRLRDRPSARRGAVGEIAPPRRAPGDKGHRQRQKDKEGDREVDARHDRHGHHEGQQIACTTSGSQSGKSATSATSSR